MSAVVVAFPKPHEASSGTEGGRGEGATIIRLASRTRFTKAERQAFARLASRAGWLLVRDRTDDGRDILSLAQDEDTEAALVILHASPGYACLVFVSDERIRPKRPIGDIVASVARWLDAVSAERSRWEALREA